MNKYDTMIACNRKTSEEKINRAITEIRQMITEKEKVTVPKLVKRTGLSRGFFYKNETVRKAESSIVISSGTWIGNCIFIAISSLSIITSLILNITDR